MTMYARHIGNRIGTYSPRHFAMETHTNPTAKGGPNAEMPRPLKPPHKRLGAYLMHSIAYHGLPGDE